MDLPRSGKPSSPPQLSRIPGDDADVGDEKCGPPDAAAQGSILVTAPDGLCTRATEDGVERVATTPEEHAALILEGHQHARRVAAHRAFIWSGSPVGLRPSRFGSDAASPGGQDRLVSAVDSHHLG